MKPTPSHMGIFVTDMERMVQFYGEVLGLTVTDPGGGHHVQERTDVLEFGSGEAPSAGPKRRRSVRFVQASFAVGSLDALREIKAKALAKGASEMRALDHGNAWSINFKDPEGNTVEAYLDSPFHVPQPHGDPLDLSKSDEKIVRATEAACRNDPSFMLRAEFVRRQSEIMSRTQ